MADCRATLHLQRRSLLWFDRPVTVMSVSYIRLTEEAQVRVKAAAERSVELWWQFFDGMERAT